MLIKLVFLFNKSSIEKLLLKCLITDYETESTARPLPIISGDRG